VFFAALDVGRARVSLLDVVHRGIVADDPLAVLDSGEDPPSVRHRESAGSMTELDRPRRRTEFGGVRER